MKITILTLSTLAFFSTTAFAETKPNVPTIEANQIFKAAGFSKTKHGWEGSCDTGKITTYKDLNGDGLKDAVISDYSTMCYGNTGVGYHIISQQKAGTWKLIFENMGIPTFYKPKEKTVGQILKMVAPDFVLLFTAGMVKNMMSTVMNITAKPAH